MFRAVCLCTAALMLVLSLLCSIRLTAVNDREARLTREIAELERENESLRVRCESRLSLEEIERYAVEKLGMQRLSGEQIIRIKTPVG